MRNRLPILLLLALLLAACNSTPENIVKKHYEAMSSKNFNAYLDTIHSEDQDNWGRSADMFLIGGDVSVSGGGVSLGNIAQHNLRMTDFEVMQIDQSTVIVKSSGTLTTLLYTGKICLFNTVMLDGDQWRVKMDHPLNKIATELAVSRSGSDMPEQTGNDIADIANLFKSAADGITSSMCRVELSEVSSRW